MWILPLRHDVRDLPKWIPVHVQVSSNSVGVGPQNFRAHHPSPPTTISRIERCLSVAPFDLLQLPRMAESKPSKVQYKILPGGVDDCSAFGHIEVVAFNDLVKEKSESSLYRFLFGPATEESQEFRAKDFVDKINESPTARFWKVVTSDPDDPSQEKIIAGAIWYFHTEPFAPKVWEDIEWPAFVNGAACNQFLKDLTGVKRKHMQGKRFGCK